ncbi:endoplasmic oxidoreductin-1 [Yamadazyma tenuis]|uniref:Endoplasmic oxidoreductin n=1 Tax=Candida tenuis (strain ATCC 10573 / BCRC 21748 / CBS 615 / JCM 9827 / NBRC 10315 / NRRL Y-1498 / VKM Y-70) TaxID=590646 RepID=G3BA84_CANTC|nr:endoplasmic oxidoreductin [Yamadazyma tenuis ATCC 10573]XP_006688675.1 uncharacterized protein CANTEDRAFT_114860 [Yamadazyma tenuis ATCC 10573]EGV62504.1 endoplasmic oxidoreductin [Yamadazyma tenuis ATCC 10573]EGV62505.1 hypothetical protein CANTEDRAFT_114860 [Yamadazyma tenuis ATCC 10573]WEJ92597.1 endoplasmic oxidoreductin-1 [Yamadazyma tenuis]
MNTRWCIIAYLLTCVLGFTPFYSSDFCSQTITNDCNTTFSYIDQINEDVYPIVKSLAGTSYFRYFKINFDKQCKFWNEEHFCSTENCAVEILPPGQHNWDEIVLDDAKPGYDHLAKSGDSCEDLDYCELDDDSSCDYINLVDNPERFTGYGGKQAHNIWQSIYEENCFKDDADKECSTKKLFFRVLSGMHASISTHLSNEYVDPFEEEMEFSPNLKIFMERVGQFNDRISNLYFNYGLVSQALVKLFKDYPVIEYLKQSEELIENDDDYLTLFGGLVEMLEKEQIFQSALIIEPELKNEVRAKFRNISSIMDCVGCDRCRMWGKLQTIGYGTAFKILFEDTNNSNLRFRKIEIVSLMNTFDRLCKSIEAVKNFKSMYLEHLQDVEKGLVQPGDFDKKTENNGFNFPFSENSNALKEKISQKQLQQEEEPLKPSRIQRIKNEWKQAYNEVFGALVFVLRSYKHFPFIMARKLLIKLNYWWGSFVGLDTHEFYDEIQLEQNYMNIFQE